MLPCARWTAGARFCDVDLIDLFEFFCRMRGKHTRQSRCETRTNHNMNVAFTSVLIKRQKRSNVGEVVGCTHHVDAPANKLLSDVGLRARRTSKHDNIDVEWIIKRAAIDARSISETVRNNFDAVSSFVAKDDLVVISRHKLSGKTRTDRSDTEDSDAGHVSRALVRRVRATRPNEAGPHLIRGAERRRRQAPPCRWQPWPVGSSSSWG